MRSSPKVARHAPRSEPPRDRDWFLRDSRWDDDEWVLAPTSARHEDRPVVIRWAFLLPNDRRFTHPRYATLLESARQHLALMRVGTAGSARGFGAYSLRTYFYCLRALIRWMSEIGITRFADFDEAAMAEFKQVIGRRRGYAARTISRETLHHYYHVLSSLYRHRGAVRDALQVDPFPGVTARAATADQPHDRKVTACTPDAVAIPLIQGAIELLSDSAVQILAARERALCVYNRVNASSGDKRRARRVMNAAMS